MPVVSDKLVYLELQKSASTLIGSVLMDLFDAEKRLPKHGRLPADCRSKFVVGSVRNPWDYYVSLWSFGCEGNGGMHQRATQRDLRTAARHLPNVAPLVHELRKPAPAWRAVYDEPHSPEQFRQWLTMIHDPDHAFEFEGRYGQSRFRHLAGFMTYRYCRLYADDFEAILDAPTAGQMKRCLEASFLPHAMIRTEQACEELLVAVRSAGHHLNHVLEEKVSERMAKPVNSSEHLHFTAYYDDASVELVAERDASIIERHGYAFASAPDAAG